MMPQPTGRLIRRNDGVYVVLDRIFKAPIEDVWASLTRSARLQTWIGEFTGLPSTRAVRFRMNAEPDSEWENVSILECEAPRRFAADIGPNEHAWRIYWHLNEASGHTTLTFGQRLHVPAEEASIGVGWDYYLDRLLAVRAGRPLPRWDDYYPDFLLHYKNLAGEFEQITHLPVQRAWPPFSVVGDPEASRAARDAVPDIRLQESAE